MKIGNFFLKNKIHFMHIWVWYKHILYIHIYTYSISKMRWSNLNSMHLHAQCTQKPTKYDYGYSLIFLIALLQFSYMTWNYFERESKTKRALPIKPAIWTTIIVYVHNLYAVQSKGPFCVCRIYTVGNLRMQNENCSNGRLLLFFSLFSFIPCPVHIMEKEIMRTKIRPVAIKQNICSQHGKRMRFIKFVRKSTRANIVKQF